MAKKPSATNPSDGGAPKNLDGEETSPTTYDLAERKQLVDLIKDNEDENVVKDHMARYINKVVADYGLETYTVLLLYDEHDPISQYHANRIYQAASVAGSDKDILLVLQSGGGSIEPAYLISKTCNRLAKARFVVSVPRRAKSAATLLALGADEIHMGLMSELGPIDPQIGGYPALSLANALNVLAELACKFPGSADMFSSYLTKNLDLKDLGYFKRVGESAAQYAERLLEGKALPGDRTPAALAAHFVDHYKEHGFVIDLDEARELLGPAIIQQETAEYRAANEIYQVLDFAGFIFDVVRERQFDYVGAVDTGLMLRPKRRE